MGLKAEVASVAIGKQSRDLTLPIDVTAADGAPDGRVAFHVAILDVYVGNAIRGQQRVAMRERNFAGDEGVGGVPDELQIGVLHGGEYRF